MGYLSEVVAGRLFVEAVLVAHDVVVEVAAVAQLQDQVELRLRVDHLVEAHHVRMLDQLHAAHLLSRSRPNPSSHRTVYVEWESLID